MKHYQWQGGERGENRDLLLHCHIQPKASRNEIVGVHGDRLKIRIAAPPVDGSANAELVKFLAKEFGVAKSAVGIVRGETGKQKTLLIHSPGKLAAKAAISREPQS